MSWYTQNTYRYWTKAVEPVYPDHKHDIDRWRRFLDQTGLYSWNELLVSTRTCLFYMVFEGINTRCVHTSADNELYLDTTLTVKQCFCKSKWACNLKSFLLWPLLNNMNLAVGKDTFQIIITMNYFEYFWDNCMTIHTVDFKIC